MKYLLTVCVTSILLAPGCGGLAPNSQSRTASSSDPFWVDSTLHRLTLDEKVSQLVFVWTLAPYYAHDSNRWQELERLAVERKLGGFIFSIGDVYEYAVQINKLQRLAHVPLLIAGDFEWGVGMRIRGSTTFPRAMAVGATRNPSYAYQIGRITALEGRAIGVQQNYAPVVDVNNNPRNPVINTRSFGDDVKLVSEMSAQFVRGTQDGGMIATVKHFPGHGDTDVDTHLALPTLSFDKERLERIELSPFREAFNAGALSVMVGHISVPAFDSVSGIPATVSPLLTTGLLKNELKFEGLVVTDAMVMNGVASKYSPGESVVLALKAGADLILMPVDADIAVDAVVAAVKRGEITEARIDASVRKLLKMKQRMGLDMNRFTDIDKIFDVVGSPESQRLAMSIARDAVTVLGNGTHILPLPKVGTKRILDIVIADTDDPASGKSFQALLHDRCATIEDIRIDPRSNQMEYDSVLAAAKNADILFCQFHLYTRSGAMTGFVNDRQVELMKKLSRLGKPVVAVTFGNPYIAMELPQFDAYVCTYSDADCMEEAAAEVLFGEEPAKGKLPIAIPGLYKFGDGVEYPKLVLRNGTPRDAGFDVREFRGVDSVVNASVRDSAFPGAVLLVARNGIIAYDKAYGKYDYGAYTKQVDVNTIFDLASVTKVIATTSAVMRLTDESRFDLNDPVVKYIPQFGQNGKEKITIYNLMVHNSGLPAWRRFYDFCNDPQCVLDSVFATGLAYATGDSSVYSDLGLITLGKVIEKVSGARLDRYVDSVFFQPLGMKNTMFNPQRNLWDRIAPTEVDTFWQKTGVAVRGRVHDENATVLGGVSGHAGLFSTASDLAVMMQMLLNGGTYAGTRYIGEATVKKFTARQSELSSRAIGWDTKTSPKSFSGTMTSMKTFLHTGFTGTSVVCDPEKNLIVVFLTNRVYPTRANLKIAAVRPRVHDAILRAMRN